MVEQQKFQSFEAYESKIQDLEEEKGQAEARGDKYRLLLTIVSGFFATGLGAILVFVLDLLELRSSDSKDYREYLTQEYEAGVFASDPIEYRLSRAEYLARVASSADERSRWSDYEKHLLSVLKEKRDVTAELQTTEQNYLSSVEANDEPNQELFRQKLNLLTSQLAEYEARSPEPKGTLKPRIYIFISNEEDRETAEKLRIAIQTAGYIAPRISLEPAGPPSSQIRYFRAAEKDVASEVFEALKSKAIVDLELRYFSGYEHGTGFRENHFELWLAESK